MVSSTAATVEQYLQSLPEPRRAVVAAVREAINACLPPGYAEVMVYGMIGWVVPSSRYPDTYNGQPLAVASLAAQKNNYSLYLNCVYNDGSHDGCNEQALRDAYARAGKKLDMGKSCLRFKKIDDLLLDDVAKLVAATPVERFIAQYEASRGLGRG